MASKSDGKTRLSEATIARIAGVKRSRRRAWAEQGLLRNGGREGYGELDACETAVLRKLAGELEFEMAREAWEGIRSELPDSLMAGILLVAVDEGRATGSLHTDAADLGLALSHPGRYAIVDISEAVADAQTGYRNAIAAKETKERGVIRSDVRELRQ
jgi:hypothetical protein